LSARRPNAPTKRTRRTSTLRALTIDGLNEITITEWRRSRIFLASGDSDMVSSETVFIDAGVTAA
jgi:hypothetical protein